MGGTTTTPLYLRARVEGRSSLEATYLIHERGFSPSGATMPESVGGSLGSSIRSHRMLSSRIGRIWRRSRCRRGPVVGWNHGTSGPRSIRELRCHRRGGSYRPTLQHCRRTGRCPRWSAPRRWLHDRSTRQRRRGCSPTPASRSRRHWALRDHDVTCRNRRSAL